MKILAILRSSLNFVWFLEASMNFTIESEQEEDGRWIAEVLDLTGVLAYGQTREEAIAKVQALALRVLADRLEHGETTADLVSVSFRAAA
jgi:predicted RNase H-like HicB family nuclease